MSYSPAERRAGAGEPASKERASRRRHYCLVLAEAPARNTTATHIEKLTNRNMHYITLTLEIYTTHKENNSYVDT